MALENFDIILRSKGGSGPEVNRRIIDTLNSTIRLFLLYAIVYWQMNLRV